VLALLHLFHITIIIVRFTCFILQSCADNLSCREIAKLEAGRGFRSLFDTKSPKET